MFISDLHCGSVFGLTPPEHFSTHHKRSQHESWQAYLNIIHKWSNPDVLVVNGDCIEGRQDKQGGAELITPDRNIQSQMAIEAIQRWNAKQIFMTYGTKYHVSDQAEDFEYGIADILNATLEGRLFLTIEGVTFDIRHKVGSSSVPYGRLTALMKEVVWDLLEEANNLGPKVNVVVRSHCHYHTYCGDPEHYAFTTPGLQLKRGRFGSREMTGRIDWGAIRITVNKGERICEEKIITKLQSNKPRIFKVE